MMKKQNITPLFIILILLIQVLFPQNVFASSIPEGTIAYYRFEDNADDSSGNHNDGEIIGEVNFVEGGYAGKAASFSGNGCIILPDGLLSSNPLFTVVMQFNTTRYGSLLAYQHVPFDDEPYIYIPILNINTQGKIHAEIWNTATNSVLEIKSETVVNDGRWHKLAMTVDPDGITVYLDDEIIGSAAGAVSHEDLDYNHIGCGYTGNRQYTSPDWFPYEGLIDELYILDRGISDDAVTELTAPADIAAATAALDESDFTFSGSDDSDNVTQNFTLPLTGDNGTTITWSEQSDSGSNVSINDSTGEVTVTQPAYGNGNAVVTLRATISKDGGTSATKDFTFTILEQEQTAVVYTVTYSSNGAISGSIPTDSNTYLQGDTVTVLGNTGNLTKTGYTFSGWNTAANGSGTSYNASETFTMGSGNVTLYAKWTAIDGGGSGNRGSGSGSGGKSSTPPANNNTDILVNGKTQGNAATAKTEEDTNGQTTTTVTFDEKKVGEILDKLPDAGTDTGTSQNHFVLTIPVAGKADTAVGELNGQMVKDMEEKGVILEIKTETATYTLPAQQIDISAVSQSFGQDVTLSDIKVRIDIAKPGDAAVKLVEDSANKGGLTLVVPPVEFKVSCAYGSETVEVSRFNNYVERTVAIPDGVDHEKITTGVIVDPDGTIRHVPTKITVIDGKYYAQINSLTNSVYSFIWNPVGFSDVVKHWARDSVNDMGSRLVVSGDGNGSYAPDRAITRAEFAAIVVKALGLRSSGNESNPFDDVKGTDWFAESVRAAYEYGIATGDDSGLYRPQSKITREQAMTMVSRAMDITGLRTEEEIASANAEQVLAAFIDAGQISSYAKAGAAACIDTGIINGKRTDLIAPKDNMTRAEVAVIMKRLLEQSDLI